MSGVFAAPLNDVPVSFGAGFPYQDGRDQVPGARAHDAARPQWTIGPSSSTRAQPLAP